MATHGQNQVNHPPTTEVDTPTQRIQLTRQLRNVFADKVLYGGHLTSNCLEEVFGELVAEKICAYIAEVFVFLFALEETQLLASSIFHRDLESVGGGGGEMKTGVCVWCFAHTHEYICVCAGGGMQVCVGIENKGVTRSALLPSNPQIIHTHKHTEIEREREREREREKRKKERKRNTNTPWHSDLPDHD